MMRLFLASFALLLFAAPCLAEFTPAENVAAAAQIRALSDAAYAISFATSHLASFPQDAPQTVDVVKAITAAYESHFDGVLYLFDLNGGGVSIGTLTRQQARDEGVNRILAPAASYSGAIAKINAMLAAGANPLGIQDAKTLLTGSESRRLGLDTTLAYAEPRPAENVAMPGATRTATANAGPHGDYRQFGDLMRVYVRNTCDWIDLASTSAVQNPAYAHVASGTSKGLNFIGVKMSRSLRLTSWALGLNSGIELVDGSGVNLANDVSTMFQSGTTKRTRHFFRVQLALELLLGWQHLAPFDHDVFGRQVYRGITYELDAACRDMADFMLADASIPAYAKSQIEAEKWICEAWANMDGEAQNELVFRYFTNVGPPGQVVGVCGPDTVLTPGPPPACIGTAGVSCGTGTHLDGTTCIADPCPVCPPQITCGFGTHLDGTNCLPDPVTCPSLSLVFVAGADGKSGTVQCVVN